MQRLIPSSVPLTAPAAAPTATVEDYLSLLYIYERDSQPTIATRLAEQLGVSLPTVSATVKRMTRDGWVSVDEHKLIHLTPDGRQEARQVMRRHFLIELMLRRMLEVPWSRLHTEAHAIEHVISDDTLARMQAKLDHPRLCPHGNPFPGEEKLVARWVKLTELHPGDHAVIRRIHELAEDSGDLMAFLEKNGLMPGTRITVREVLPFNETLVVETAGGPVVLGLSAAQWVYADPGPAAPR
jgi:DtxR family transcriptional regulator, Mn-dependent transcriptional regulator